VKILLDTHAMYWYIEGDLKMSSTAESLIRNLSNEVLISPASYWEVAVKVSLGKWQLNRPFVEFVEIGLFRYGFHVLPILYNHAAHLISMPMHHRDPFDRMLIAQALAEDMPILSCDTALDAYGVVRLW